MRWWNDNIAQLLEHEKEKKHVVRALETVGLSIIQAITVIANVKENTVSKIGAVA